LQREVQDNESKQDTLYDKVHSKTKDLEQE
jgi:hypothetical protein